MWLLGTPYRHRASALEPWERCRVHTGRPVWGQQLDIACASESTYVRACCAPSSVDGAAEQ